MQESDCTTRLEGPSGASRELPKNLTENFVDVPSQGFMGIAGLQNLGFRAVPYGLKVVQRFCTFASNNLLVDSFGQLFKIRHCAGIVRGNGRSYGQISSTWASGAELNFSIAEKCRRRSCSIRRARNHDCPQARWAANVNVRRFIASEAVEVKACGPEMP